MRYSASTRAGDRALLGSISSIDPAAGMSEARRKPASLSPPNLAQQRQNPVGLETETPVSNNDLFLCSSGLSRYFSFTYHWLGGPRPLCGLLRQCARLKASHGMRPVTNHHGTIQHFVNGHCATRQRIPPACLADLEHPIIQHYRVVLVHVALVLNREHPIQILAPGCDKRATTCCAATENRRLNSFTYCARRNRLAASTVAMPRNRSSCGRRPCQVR